MSQPCLLLGFFKQLVDLANFVDLAGEGSAEYAAHGGGVFVDVRRHFLGRENMAVGLERHDSRFDVEIESELFPARVYVGAEHHVRALGVLALGDPPLSPRPFMREQAQHNGFA